MSIIDRRLGQRRECRLPQCVGRWFVDGRPAVASDDVGG